MRLGVLDVGSNTVHLLVVDAHPGARPWPATSHKVELQLARHLGEDGRIDPDGERALVRFIASCLEIADDQGAEELLAAQKYLIQISDTGAAQHRKQERLAALEKALNAPEKNPETFQALLPFAMALGVEKQWAAQFKDIYMKGVDWYSGVSRGAFNPATFANDMTAFAATAQTTMRSAPAGGSGAGGGGFSGGGFGGGGGGSW